MRKFELINFEPGGVPKISMQKILPWFPEMKVSDEESLFRGFNIEKFFKMRTAVHSVIRGEELQKSWYHRCFNARDSTCFDEIEILVDNDLTRNLGYEYYVSSAFMQSDGGVSPGNGDYRSAEHCLEIIRGIYAKVSPVENHVSLRLIEKMFDASLKVLGKNAKFQIATGEISATVSHTEFTGTKEGFASLISFKIKQRR